MTLESINLQLTTCIHSTQLDFYFIFSHSNIVFKYTYTCMVYVHEKRCDQRGPLEKWLQLHIDFMNCWMYFCRTPSMFMLTILLVSCVLPHDIYLLPITNSISLVHTYTHTHTFSLNLYFVHIHAYKTLLLCMWVSIFSEVSVKNSEFSLERLFVCLSICLVWLALRLLCCLYVCVVCDLQKKYPSLSTMHGRRLDSGGGQQQQ